MSTAMPFDEDLTRRIVEVYTTPDVVAQRDATLEILDLQPGERVLDIGSGPGFLAAGIASRVGESGAVSGIDLSEPMIAHASGLEAAPGAAQITFALGDATALGFSDQSFDAVVSTQVYEYVEEIERALDEAHRVLRPGGRLAVLDTDWGSIVWRSPNPERTARVLAVWDEHLADPWLPRQLGGLMRAAGFTLDHTEAIPLLNTGFAEQTYSANLIGFVERFVSGQEGIDQDEVAAWAAGQRSMGDDYFFSLNRYLFTATRPG